MGVERNQDDWRDHNLATLVLAFVRVLKDAALAWDVSAETMAAAALNWSAFPGGSRMAWVLGHGRRVVRDAAESRRVSSQERTRNRVTAAKALSLTEQRTLIELAGEPLKLDAQATEMVDALSREAPPPELLLEIGLSPLTVRGSAGARSRERADG